jgi:hypothetical protein
MKASIICLVLFLMFFSPLVTETRATSAIDTFLENVPLKSEQVFNAARDKINPHKKPKQQRKTILNHKFKVGRGHHCPTF